ncbi:MAG: hypothetical protein U0P48_05520 [Ancrocorticia sp.]
MDQEMHRCWLRAERRIDVSLAGITFFVLWCLAVPITVVLTELSWNSRLSMALVAAIPLAVIFVGVLLSSLRVVHAIEERDEDEIERWRSTGILPREPNLLRARQRRDHYPMLLVVAFVNFYVTAVAAARIGRSTYHAMSEFALGILLASLGIGLCAVVLATSLNSRGKTWGLILVGWPVPAGIFLCAASLVLGSNEISSEVLLPAMTAIVYVILGIIVFLVGLSVFALWLAWLARAFKGEYLFAGVPSFELARMVRGSRGSDLPDYDDFPVQSLEMGVGDGNGVRDDDGAGPDGVEGERADGLSSRQILAPPEFDEVDVEIVREALRFSRTDVLLALLILVSTAMILVLSHIGYAGTPHHGVVAALLLGATLTYVYRVWQVF